MQSFAQVPCKMEPFVLVESPCSLLPLAADDIIEDVANYAEVDNMADEGQVHFVDAQEEEEEEEDLVPNEEEVEEDAAGQIDSKEEMQHTQTWIWFTRT